MDRELIRETTLAHFKILDAVFERELSGKFDKGFEAHVQETRKKLISIFETHYTVKEYRFKAHIEGQPLVLDPVYREDATDIKDSIEKIVEAEINHYLIRKKQNSKKQE